MPARNIVFGEIEGATRVIIQGYWTSHVGSDEHADWLAEYGKGNFRRYAVPHLDDEEPETVYEFSDPDTAFAFKMRFG